ncbi:DUF5105 domain-containing protein [Clostridium cellulovorans]|uniref:DUF5105 domain-containing protein n=1 Tax=Clostridium cellulovorans (strain ATCC 35296 / DSM 3052 / OCM 3 / 743B) TaxID=573061 RepID=D9SPH7_CLOC7|nr:DUF5105 domain-containing protein [Clostridium cellulovorans]ADL50026.1 hypothetical protein Clocel_0242 [Clostridium cellulovorans 743B]
MKKLKKFFAVLIVSVMSAVMLTACGSTKASPEESAEIFLDVLLKNDKSNMDKIGMEEDDYTKFREAIDYGLMEGFAGSISDPNVLTEDIKNTLKENIITGFSKVEYKVVSSEIDGDIAKVNVEIKGFDMNTISANIQARLQEDLKANPAMTQPQMLQTSLKYIGESIANGVIVQEPKTITLALAKDGNTWLPGENDIVTLMEALVS